VKAFTKNHIVHILFLELLSITPILIILGNVVPPIPIKIHFVGMGLIFICALYLLIESKYQLTVLILSSILVVSQFVLNYWDIKNIIDFLFGPLVLIIMFDLLVNKRIPNDILLKYQKRFFNLLWVPIGIGVLQYFEMLPITFWNASYVNYSYIGDVQIPRPNGFLYHGSELSILICFAAISQFFNKKIVGTILLLAIVIIAYTTYFKAILGCVLALVIVYFFSNIVKMPKFMSRISDKFILIASSIGASTLLAGIIAFLFQTYQKTGYFFHPQLMTGRGSIWNIFTDAIADYSVLNFLFGSGIGSGPDLFTTYASAENYYILSVGQPLDVAYDAHNALLSLFVNSGLLGLISLVTLYFVIFSHVKTWQNSARKNKYLWLLFTIIPLLTIGITIPLFDMAIIWPCLGFLLIKWKNTSYAKIN
jgi:hypothetical protein